MIIRTSGNSNLNCHGGTIQLPGIVVFGESCVTLPRELAHLLSCVRVFIRNAIRKLGEYTLRKSQCTKYYHHLLLLLRYYCCYSSTTTTCAVHIQTLPWLGPGRLELEGDHRPARASLLVLSTLPISSTFPGSGCTGGYWGLIETRTLSQLPLGRYTN